MNIIKKLTAAVIAAAAVCLMSVQADAISPDTPFPIAWQQGENSGAERQRTAYINDEESWCHYPWNRGTETGNTVGKAGCSLLSVVNTLYYHTGEFINPVILAEYALEEGYRTVGYDGVRKEFFEAFTVDFGYEYGMTYSGETKSAEETLAHIRAGGVSSSNIYGHCISIVDYDEENGLYLLLDSSQLSTRCDNIEWADRLNGVTWLDEETLMTVGAYGNYGIEGRASHLFEIDYTFVAELYDADSNGVIGLDDATAVLNYYALYAAGYEDLKLHPHPVRNMICLKAADVDKNGSINIDDAVEILTKYASNAAGSPDTDE